MLRQLFLCVCLLSASLASEKEFLSNTLGSGMVLPRAPNKAALWGWVKPGEQVTATLEGKTTSAVVDKEGYWKIELDPRPAGGPHSIVINGTSTQVTLNDILFGDVYFCSGQSNMQFAVDQSYNASQEIAGAGQYHDIRIFGASLKMFANYTLHNLIEVAQPWARPNTTNVPHFSAVCWFFGKDLNIRTKVPIGLISSNWGGTAIQPWSSPVALSKCHTPVAVAMDIESEVQSAGSIYRFGWDNPNEHPSSLWNSMVYPFLNWRLSGVAWYQGESNQDHPKYYGCAFPAMISDWRLNWKIPFLPFFFVQLATWRGDVDKIPELRIEQTLALRLRNVAMGTAFDLSDAQSPAGDIHPRNKSEVGRRLSLAARSIIYKENVLFTGPIIRRVQRKEVNNSTVVTISFARTSLAGGLVLNAPMKCPFEEKFCGKVVEIQDQDNQWHAATYQVSGSSFILKAEGVSGAKSARYAWADYPLAVLYNKAQLPLTPFVVKLH